MTIVNEYERALTKPKLDIGLFVDICVFHVFTSFCMTWSYNCFVDQKKTIIWSGYSKTVKNREKNRNEQTIQCQALA